MAQSTWTGGGDGTTWSTSNASGAKNNWGGTAFATNNNVTFGGTVGLTPSIGATALAAGSITFANTAGAFNISGTATLTINGGIVNNDNNLQTFSVAGITLGAAQTWNAGTVAGGGLSFSSTTLNLGANQTLTFSGSNNTSLSSLISGTGSSGLTKNGAGTLTLGGASANTYTGATSISVGTLEVTKNGALGTTAAGTSVTAGAALKLTNVNYTTAEDLTLNGTGISSGGALVNSGTSTYSGQITAASNATINSGAGTLNLNGGLVKNGTTLTLTGGGLINVSNVGISGASAGSDLVIDATNVVTTVNSTYNGPTSVINGATLTANNPNTGSATGTGTVTIDSTSTLAGSGRVDAGTGNFIFINGTLQAGSTGDVSAVDLDLATSGAGATQMGSGSNIFLDLWANNSGLTTNESDRIRLFGNLNFISGATITLLNSGSLASFADGDSWQLFDLSGGGTLSGPVAVDTTAFNFGSLLGTFNLTTGTFTLSSIPEPSRVVLIFLGLAACTLRRQRRMAC